MDGRNHEAHYNLGVALLRSSPGNPEALQEALAHSLAAATLNPRVVQARINASYALLLLGRPAEAETEAREALRLDPGSTPARIDLAEALFRQSRYREAAEEFRGAVRVMPADPGIRSPYVVSLINAGDLESARRETEAARRDFPQIAWFDFCLARVEARSGHLQQALGLLKAAAGRDRATARWIEQVDDFGGLKGNREFRALLGTPSPAPDAPSLD